MASRNLSHGVVRPILYAFIGAGVAIACQQILKPKSNEEIAAEGLAATVAVKVANDDVGSGWFMDDRGDVMTANHIVDSASKQITVTLADGTTHKATVIHENKDENVDATILHVDKAEGHSFLKWGNSGKIRPGQTVFAIGSPFAEGLSVTKGIISAWPHLIKGQTGIGVQHDAATNPGNSGGPVVNDRCEVIGLNDMIVSDGRSAQNSGVSYAIPSNVLLHDIPAALRPQPYQPAEIAASQMVY